MNTFDQATTIVNSRFEGNECTDSDCDGGGLRMLASFNNPSLTLINSDFINNTAGGRGGGVVVGNLVQVSVTNGRFQNNRALTNDGGGLATSGSVTFSGNWEVNNNTVGQDGGTVDITNTIIARYMTGIENVGGVVTSNFNLFFGNGNDTVGTIASSNTLVGNPGFVDAATDDFRLVDGSIAVDSGTDAGVTTDILGGVRPQDAWFDRGAYEGRYKFWFICLLF